MPSAMLNVFDTFNALGKTLKVLRAPEDIIDSLKTNNDSGRVIHTEAMKSCEVEAILGAGTQESSQSREQVLRDLKETVKKLRQIQLPQLDVANEGSSNDEPRIKPSRVT
ncbi:hypothetical protein F4779DRAFT_643423 [Xylariaceae sp. FL0662B]|nr:hypothetical protein F4779DRAFT_643423 [Xylariaceae sp. FL0662B]